MKQISNKIVKTRKPHQCFACLKTYHKGTTMERQVNIYDGRVFSLYTCEECQKLMIEHYDDLVYDYDDPLTFPNGCVHEWKNENRTKRR